MLWAICYAHVNWLQESGSVTRADEDRSASGVEAPLEELEHYDEVPPLGPLAFATVSVDWVLHPLYSLTPTFIVCHWPSRTSGRRITDISLI